MLSPKGDKVWVAFNYERLLGMCYNCGKLAHEERDCLLPKTSEHGERQYGDWLRVGNQKVEKLKVKKYNPPTRNKEGASGQSRETSETLQHHDT